ncbi:MAG: hypothetical protein HYX24_03035 [Candidatus Aenigmarchaeota archaeon]|nr:hypothetical protein [Candidatus Aenigmarchaeota archaeon]
MQKHEIVRRFLDEGILISPQLLASLENENLEEAISEAKAVNAPVFSSKKPYEVSIQKNEIRGKLEPADMASFYKSKYEGIRDLLKNRVDAVSINRLGNVFGDTAAIGMVSELFPNGFVIEDTTASIQVISKERPDIDDVIAVKGAVRENRIFASEVIYPDIPILRKIKSLSMSIAFLEAGQQAAADIRFSFEPADACKLIPNPAHIRVKKDGESMYIVAYQPPSEIGIRKAAELLKKRHLMLDKSQIKAGSDCFILREEPDIVWIMSRTSEKLVYKGTLVVCGPAVINLQTKHVDFI